MISENRRRWIDAGKRVLQGEREGILCPENQDGFLQVEWIPMSSGHGGEWRLYCPSCGVENFILQREP